MKTFVKKAAGMVVGLAVIVMLVGSMGTISAEELRLMTYEGNPPLEQVEIFKTLVKAKYGIDLDVKMSYISDPSEYLKALKNREVDIIKCPHNIPKDARYKFISGKLILPIDLNNVPNYQDLMPIFQKADYITEEGEVYGVPVIYAPYGLAYNTSLLSEPPASWTAFWDPQYAGKYAIGSDYEQNINITALALGIERSKIGQYDVVISPEFQEKVTALIKNAKAMWVGVDTADILQGLAFSPAWGFSFTELKNRGEIWQFANPGEGMMGGIGCIMLSHTLRENPTLKQVAEEFANFLISPDYQVNIVVRTLSAGAVNAAITDRLTPEEVAASHLDDPQNFQEKFIPYPILDARSRQAYELIWKKATR